MDRERALDLLPEAHALALRLAADGADPATIASRLDIEHEAVPLLLRVAEDTRSWPTVRRPTRAGRKLATLLGRSALALADVAGW